MANGLTTIDEVLRVTFAEERPTEGEEDVNRTVVMRDLLVAMARNASDLHITAGAADAAGPRPPRGPGLPALDGEQTKALAYSLINAEQRERFESNHELTSPTASSGSRYRVNVYRQRGVVGVAIRSIPTSPRASRS